MGPQMRQSNTPEPDLGGSPSDPTDVQRGAEKFGNPPASSIPAGTTHASTPASSELDDFDVDFEEPAKEPEAFVPAGSAKKRSSRKRPAAAPATPALGAVEDPAARAARRKRVAAQDVAGMGGKTKPVGRVKVK